MITLDQIDESRLEEIYEVATTENQQYAELQTELEPMLIQARQAGMNVPALESVIFDMVATAIEESYLYGLNGSIRRRSA